jgi:hypothetical protein
VEKELGDIHARAGELHNSMREALADGRIDLGEDSDLRDLVRALRRDADDIEAILNQARRRGGRLES